MAPPVVGAEAPSIVTFELESGRAKKSKSKANERARGAAVAQCPDSRGDALRKDVEPREPDRPCFIEDKVKKF